MKRLGFSLVEMVVVVVVIAVLAAVTVFFVSNWRSEAAETEVKSDLTNAANVLEDYKNFNSVYPANQAAFNNLYNNTDTVTLNYTRRANGTYCINGSSTERTNVRWYIDSNVSKSPNAGTC